MSTTSRDPEVAELILDAVPGTMRLIRTLLRAAAKAELSPPQLRILSHVSRGTATASELADLQGVSPVAISKMTDVLVNRKLLTRTYKEGNRKQVYLKITDAGAKVYQRARKATCREIASRLAESPATDKQDMQRGLLALCKAFDIRLSSHQE